MISDISRDKLKVPLDVFIVLTVPDISHTPHTLTIRGRGQIRVQPTKKTLLMISRKGNVVNTKRLLIMFSPKILQELYQKPGSERSFSYRSELTGIVPQAAEDSES